MNDNVNQYILLWQKYIYEMKDALVNKDFNKFEELERLAKDAYLKYREDTKLTYECKNFGIAKAIFEDKLPTLFKHNKKAVKEFINTIKEDKNLLAQFQFYKALENFNCDTNSVDYVNESLNLVKNIIDYKTLNESNNKLYKVITKYDIKPTQLIAEECLKLYESCDYILSTKKKLTNLTEITNNVKKVGDYIDNHKKETINENKENIYEMIEMFDKKYSSLLTEEEKTFVQELTDFKAKGADSKKAKLFNRFKNECITIVNTLLKECDTDVKDNLLNVKEQLMNKEYCNETLVKDMAKLLEIRDILMEQK